MHRLCDIVGLNHIATVQLTVGWDQRRVDEPSRIMWSLVQRFIASQFIPRVSPLRDGILMLLSDQTDNIVRAVDNDCKKTGYVTTQHADVERFQLGDGGIVAPEYDLASLLTSEPDLGFDDH